MQTDKFPNGKHMPHQQTSSQIDKAIIHVLQAEADIKLAILYGSAAKGRLRADSDVDLALLCHSPLTPERKMQLAMRLHQKLLRQVDLVDLSTLSGTLLKQVLCHGRLLIKNDTNAYAALLQRMVYNQTDMRPYVTRTLLERQRRFVDG